jgi:hypothetical protein
MWKGENAVTSPFPEPTRYWFDAEYVGRADKIAVTGKGKALSSRGCPLMQADEAGQKINAVLVGSCTPSCMVGNHTVTGLADPGHGQV